MAVGLVITDSARYFIGEFKKNYENPKFMGKGYLWCLERPPQDLIFLRGSNTNFSQKFV